MFKRMVSFIRADVFFKAKVWRGIFLKTCECSKAWNKRAVQNLLNHNKSLDLPYVPMFKCGAIINIKCANVWRVE